MTRSDVQITSLKTRDGALRVQCGDHVGYVRQELFPDEDGVLPPQRRWVICDVLHRQDPTYAGRSWLLLHRCIDTLVDGWMNGGDGC